MRGKRTGEWMPQGLKWTQRDEERFSGISCCTQRACNKGIWKLIWTGDFWGVPCLKVQKCSKEIQRTKKHKKIPKNHSCHMSPPQFPHMAPVSFPSAARDKGGKKTSRQPSCPGRLPFESTLIYWVGRIFTDMYSTFTSSSQRNKTCTGYACWNTLILFDMHAVACSQYSICVCTEHHLALNLCVGIWTDEPSHLAPTNRDNDEQPSGKVQCPIANQRTDGFTARRWTSK